MAKYMRESGRIRAQEQSFNFEMGGDPNPRHTVECLHGWYRTQPRKKIEVCVKCDKPREVCERELAEREEQRQADIRWAQRAL